MGLITSCCHYATVFQHIIRTGFPETRVVLPSINIPIETSVVISLVTAAIFHPAQDTATTLETAVICKVYCQFKAPLLLS